MELVGRQAEILLLEEAKLSSEAELIALYGRRRVGKTFLIRNYFKEEMLMEWTGLNGVPIEHQLENFVGIVGRAFKLPVKPATPKTWIEAFNMLINLLEANPIETKKVLFLDEFPWLDSPRSNFLPAFDFFWNNWASRQDNLIVVICGSAASWMVQNIIRNKGGLHNRITVTIQPPRLGVLRGEQ